jgi:hypothetical protein
LGLLLKVLAAVVYLQFVATQVYDPLLAGVGLEIWRILDPLMVLGLAVALVNSYHRKRQVVSVADDGVTREYLEANCVFYLGIALMAGMLWNWIGSEVPDPENTIAPLWTVIDVTLPLLLFATGAQLTRSSS